MRAGEHEAPHRRGCNACVPWDGEGAREEAGRRSVGDLVAHRVPQAVGAGALVDEHGVDAALARAGDARAVVGVGAVGVAGTDANFRPGIDKGVECRRVLNHTLRVFWGPV